MIERSFCFGPHDSLSGILTMPDGPHAPLVVLLSNTGMHHRVGPYRLNVELARTLAGVGVPVLRYDRSGLGDSLPRGTAGSDHDHALLDARDAMDALTARTGITRFALVALCSGVDVYHEVACADPRVVGLVLIDGHAYPTGGYRRRRLLRFFEWPRFVRSLRRRRHRRQHAEFFGTQSHAAAVFNRPALSLTQWRDDLLTMAARGARILMINTGAADAAWNSDHQLDELIGATPHAGRLSSLRMPKADHLFSSPGQRQHLGAHLARWAQTVATDQGDNTKVDTLKGGSDTVTRLLLTA